MSYKHTWKKMTLFDKRLKLGDCLFLDIDIIIQGDLNILIDYYNKNKVKGKVMLGHVHWFDNEKMKGKVPPVSKQKKMAGNYTAQIYWTFLSQAAHFDDRWNCLDGEGRKPEDIYHLHFTDVPTQPWQPQWAKDKGHKHRPHPRKDLVEIWKQYRDEALANIN